MDKHNLLLADARGVYIPKDFYEGFHLDKWGIDPEEYEGLSNIESEYYWDDWDRLLNNAEYTDDDGNKWMLYQDGNLWAVRTDADEAYWEKYFGVR